MQQHVSAEEFRIFAARFGLDQPANFEGKWHLHAHQPIEEIAKQADLDVETGFAAIEFAEGAGLFGR